MQVYTCDQHGILSYCIVICNTSLERIVHFGIMVLKKQTETEFYTDRVKDPIHFCFIAGEQ